MAVSTNRNKLSQVRGRNFSKREEKSKKTKKGWHFWIMQRRRWDWGRFVDFWGQKQWIWGKILPFLTEKKLAREEWE